MFYIGIDIASRKHDCCILNQDGTVAYAFSFPNNKAGFQLALKRIFSVTTPENARIGLEATGIYGVNLTDFLRRNGFDVITINPLIAKKQSHATTLRKTKTDKADALLLARMLIRENFQSDPETVYHTSELKSLSRARKSAVDARSALKNKAKAVLMLLFPELDTFFSDVFGVSSLAILERYPSAIAVARAPVSSLEKILLKASRGRFGREKALALKRLAQDSIGTVSPARALELQELLILIRAYDASISRMEKKLNDILKTTGSTITSIPGIGTVLGAMILGEIGYIHNFASPGKLLAFAGLEPSVNESGSYKQASGKMVKRGSPYLRYALIQAAKYAANTHPLFSEYLNKKLSEGKHYTVAVSHLAKKLTRILFAILKNNSIFSSDYSLLAA